MKGNCDVKIRNNFGRLNQLQFSSATAVSLSSTDYAPGDAFNVYIGVTGAIKVDMADGDAGVIFAGMPVGLTPLIVTKIYKIGTDATSIIALR
jgi:hypothetical protein